MTLSMKFADSAHLAHTQAAQDSGPPVQVARPHPPQTLDLPTVSAGRESSGTLTDVGTVPLDPLARKVL